MTHHPVKKPAIKKPEENVAEKDDTPIVIQKPWINYRGKWREGKRAIILPPGSKVPKGERAWVQVTDRTITVCSPDVVYKNSTEVTKVIKKYQHGYVVYKSWDGIGVTEVETSLRRAGGELRYVAVTDLNHRVDSWDPAELEAVKNSARKDAPRFFKGEKTAYRYAYRLAKKHLKKKEEWALGTYQKRVKELEQACNLLGVSL